MNRKGIAGIIGCIIILTATACRDEVSDLLKGKWQLKTIEQGASVSRVDTVWYNFQSESLFMYQIYDRQSNDYKSQYGYKTQPDAHTLHLEMFSYSRPVQDFLPLTDWPEKERLFTVEKIGGKHLVLKVDGITYTFDRF